MKLGIFDSGLGGLVITKAIREYMPDIDIVYFGDTLHLPYGSRSSETIYTYAKRAVDFLFAQDCVLIITACNTVSASALRRLQQEYLPQSKYKERRILGVVVPTLEAAIDAGHHKIGLIGTNFTIESGIYSEELKKINDKISLTGVATPLLVPLIENHGKKWLHPILEDYLEAIQDNQCECLILGCTHYPFCKKDISSILGNNIAILSQDQIIPVKLADYLSRHKDINKKISRHGDTVFYVSDLTSSYTSTATEIYGMELVLQELKFNYEMNAYCINEKRA